MRMWKLGAACISGIVIVLLIETIGMWNLPFLFLVPWFFYHMFKSVFGKGY